MGEGRLNQFNPGGKDERCDANIKRFSNLALGKLFNVPCSSVTTIQSKNVEMNLFKLPNDVYGV
jgi:hypothetical protein